MKKSVFSCPLAMAICLLFFMNSVHAQSSQKANLFNSLNGLLEKYSMTEVRLELLDDGTILRKDGNGNFFKFNLKDIKNFEIDYDGVIGNLLLKCDPNQDCIYYEMDGGSRKGKFNFNVISFKPDTNVQEVLDLFERLKEAIGK